MAKLTVKCSIGTADTPLAGRQLVVQNFKTRTIGLETNVTVLVVNDLNDQGDLDINVQFALIIPKPTQQVICVTSDELQELEKSDKFLMLFCDMSDDTNVIIEDSAYDFLYSTSGSTAPPVVESPQSVRRGRGRPPGAKNKKNIVDDAVAELTATIDTAIADVTEATSRLEESQMYHKITELQKVAAPAPAPKKGAPLSKANTASAPAGRANRPSSASYDQFVEMVQECDEGQLRNLLIARHHVKEETVNRLDTREKLLSYVIEHIGSKLSS